MIGILLFIITCLIAGTASGLLGLGGGTIIVPSLDIIFLHKGVDPSVVMHLAVGTSLAAMVITSQASARTHQKHGHMEWDIFLKLLPGIIIGIVAGIVLADFLPTAILRILFGLFLLLVALRMFFPARPAPHRGLPGNIGMTIAGIFIGFKSGLLGLGAGTIVIPFLLYCNVPMRKIVGIAAMCTLVISIIGAIGWMITGWNEANLPPWSTGYVHWPAVIGISVPSIIAALIAAKYSKRVPETLLKRLFAVFLLFIAVHTLWR